MGMKSLSGKRHPSGKLQVDSACGAGGPRFESWAASPIFTPPVPKRQTGNEKGTGVGGQGSKDLQMIKIHLNIVIMHTHQENLNIKNDQILQSYVTSL